MQVDSSNSPTIETFLPDTAPEVHLTVGTGTAGQKAWNLRRPVTLIGSRRPAHIVLHDEKASEAHCLIVNTGEHVLVSDLATTHGTRLDGRRLRGTRVLRDGATITIGTTELLLSVKQSERTPSRSLADEREIVRLANPVALHLEETDAVWRIDTAVTLIGRHERADVHLDHENVSMWHAVVFRFMDGLAVYDTGSRNGVWVRGERVGMSNLMIGDRIMVGPFALTLLAVGSHEDESSTPQETSDDSNSESRPAQRNPGAPPTLHSPFAIWQHAAHEQRPGSVTHPPGEDWSEVVRHVARHPADAWTQMQVLPALPDGSASTSPDGSAATLGMSEDDVSQIQAGVHDDGPTGEERLRRRVAKIERREDELLQRETALRKREQALVRRWTQLLSTRCRDCGSAVITPGSIGDSFDNDGS